MTNISGDLITASMVLTPLVVALWYFFRRWMAHMEHAEAKFEASINRVHARIDEYMAANTELAGRVAHLEGKMDTHGHG